MHDCRRRNEHVRDSHWCASSQKAAGDLAAKTRAIRIEGKHLRGGSPGKELGRAASLVGLMSALSTSKTVTTEIDNLG